jgi:spore maturation protein CgeB
MRILHVANFGELKYGEYYYNTDHKISLGLIRNGHYVYNFSYRDITRCESWFKSTRLSKNIPNAKLVTACRNIKPDLLLLGHSETITNETLAEIKKENSSLKIAMWYVDPLFTPPKTEYISARVPFLNALFFTTSGPLAEKFSIPGVTVSFFPNIVDQSIESEKAFEQNEYDYDIIYCGRDSDTSERQQLLLNLFQRLKNDLKIKYFGCLGNELLYGRDYMVLLSKTRMSFNLNRRNDIELYSSDRIAQLTGNGVLTFCPEIPGFTSLYTEEEIVYFSSVDDLIGKLYHYKNDQTEMRRIAYNGWKKSHEKYNSQRVTQFMIDTIYNNCSPDFFLYEK